MKWEYDTWTRGQLLCDGGPIERELNGLGADGWELVAVIPATAESCETYYFKRPLGDSPKAPDR